MGCVIAGNRKERVIPSILDANAKGFSKGSKQDQYVRQSRGRPSIEGSEAFVAGSTCFVETQNPKTESELNHQSLNKLMANDGISSETHRGQKAKLSGFAGAGKETEDVHCGQQDSAPKIILSQVDNSLMKSDVRVSNSFFERPLASSLRSTAHFGSTQAEINENNSNYQRHNHKTSSLVEAVAESNVFTFSKHESVRSIPCWPGCEERPSLEDLQLGKKMSIEKRTPSLGAIDAVEEVSASREFNLKTGEGDDNIISNIPSINSIEKSPRENTTPREPESSGRKEKAWQIKIIRSSTHQIKEERGGREIQKMNTKSQSFPVKRKITKAQKAQDQENKENESKLAGNSIVKPAAASKAILNLVENNGNINKVTVAHAHAQEEALVKRQSSKKCLNKELSQSTKKQKAKEQAKAKFTRNLVDLVTHRACNGNQGDDSDDDYEDGDFFGHKPAAAKMTARSVLPQDDQNESLSLMNCIPDEIDHDRPNLIDLKNLDLFGDGEGFSPISPDRPDYGENTPLTSVISTFRRRDVESPSMMEDRTITNIEDNISKLDIDKYSFTAEVRAVEIDEKNNYNIYNNVKPSRPHEPVKRSAFVIKPRRVFKSKTEIYNKIKSAELHNLINKGSLADEVLSASALNNCKRIGKDYPGSSKL